MHSMTQVQRMSQATLLIASLYWGLETNDAMFVELRARSDHRTGRNLFVDFDGLERETCAGCQLASFHQQGTLFQPPLLWSADSRHITCSRTSIEQVTSSHARSARLSALFFAPATRERKTFIPFDTRLLGYKKQRFRTPAFTCGLHKRDVW